MIRQVYAVSLETIYKPAEALGGKSATISNLVGPLITNILIISGLLAFFVIIISGFNYVTGGGDKAKVQQAQNMLNYAILGLVLVVTAFLITRLISAIFGLTFF